jgi:hypothetical protein
MIETKCKPALCPWGLAPTLAGDGDNRMLHVNRECGTSAVFLSFRKQERRARSQNRRPVSAKKRRD